MHKETSEKPVNRPRKKIEVRKGGLTVIGQNSVNTTKEKDDASKQRRPADKA